MPEVQQTAEIEVTQFGGQITAINPAEIPTANQRKAQNAVMRTMGTICKRDGTAPVTTAALAAAIKHMTEFKPSPTVLSTSLLAASGVTLYKFNGIDTLVGQTMTNPLVSSDIYTVGFTDSANVTILFIADGGSVKQYDNTAVKNVVPAPNDASPAPPNDLTNINAKNPKYCWVHTGHIFVSDGTDAVWYSKRYFYDYFPSVQFERWVRNGDYITGPGISYGNACMIPMRRGWGMLSGEVFDDGAVTNGFAGNQFLNTVNGCIAARSIQRLTYSDGQQTVAFLSDDGVYEIYDTGAIDSGSRQYATRSLMVNEIDFNAIGFTEAEKVAATAYYDAVQNLYILAIKRGATDYAFVYDTRNGQWYQWINIKAHIITRFANTLYYGASTGHLVKFDPNLYSDWDQAAKTSGTPVDFDVYSGLVSFEFSGYESYLDYYMVEAKQWNGKSSLDVYMIYGRDVDFQPSALKAEIFIWGVTNWGEGQWANLNYTDNLNQAKRLIYKKKGRYFQRRWSNNRDEPVEIYREKFIGRLSNR